MKLVKTTAEMQKISLQLRAKGKTLGFVPTMGALHQGHASLLKRARQENDFTALSIFVNPAQFAPNEDYKNYPRNLKADLQLARKQKVDFAFIPQAKQMYPEGFGEFVEPGKIAKPLCGKFRPGHFRGVATIVAKLFRIVVPARAYFGQKDFQQTLVVKQLVRRLNLPIEVIVCPTIREKSGLAKSSRNAYLSPAQRKAATILFRALQAAKKLFSGGERNAKRLQKAMLGAIAKEPTALVQYCEVRDAHTLEPRVRIRGPVVAALAVFIGKTRLIDNELLGG